MLVALLCGTYLLLLLVEVVDDHADEEVEREERPEDDEEHEVEVHVDVHLADRLLTDLQQRRRLELNKSTITIVNAIVSQI